MRTAIAAGWRPPPPFATHGGVGEEVACSPTAMREWLLAEPGEVTSTDNGQAHDSSSGSNDDSSRTGQQVNQLKATLPARRAWPGGKTTSNAAAALSRFMERKTIEPSAMLQRACQLAQVHLPPLTAEERVENLRPPTAAGTDPPEWLTKLAADAPQGEHFWE
jgi:hypothetical protein